MAQSGTPELARRRVARARSSSADDADRRRALEELGLRSAMVVPLRSRGRTHGVITLATSASDRRYDESDLAFAVELARRAATAVDTARLYQDRDQVARTLQRTLLPPTLPDIPYAEIAAVYHPAGEGSEIGGDFYDAFETGDGAWAIAIGDVCGKGAGRGGDHRAGTPHAAGGGVPGALAARRARAAEPGTPARGARGELLHRRAGRLAATRRGRAPHRLRRRPPSAARPAKRRERRRGDRPGTLLGIYSEIDVSDRETVLAPGESVVFYTDGVDRGAPREGEQFGEDRLRELLAAVPGLSATGSPSGSSGRCSSSSRLRRPTTWPWSSCGSRTPE